MKLVRRPGGVDVSPSRIEEPPAFWPTGSNVVIDTNVLIRLVVQDDEKQAVVAMNFVSGAQQVVIPLTVFCETAWVLTGRYGISRMDVAETFETLLGTEGVVTQYAAVEMGIGALRANGDFADAVIAFEGMMQGGDLFVTFDKKAASIVGRSGIRTKLLEG